MIRLIAVTFLFLFFFVTVTANGYLLAMSSDPGALVPFTVPAVNTTSGYISFAVSITEFGIIGAIDTVCVLFLSLYPFVGAPIGIALIVHTATGKFDGDVRRLQRWLSKRLKDCVKYKKIADYESLETVLDKFYKLPETLIDKN